MSKEAGFLIYCMERYRHFKGLSGSEVADLFESCKVDEYIMKYFESLHTMGEQYIIKDIDDYIAEMKKENLIFGNMKDQSCCSNNAVVSLDDERLFFYLIRKFVVKITFE